MKKIVITLIIIFVLLTLVGCSSTEASNDADNDKLIVAASIVPEAGFVEAVAGSLVEIVTIIPPGNSPANYQPTTQEMQALSDADIYFVMNVPTEEANILPKISDFNENIKMVNLRNITSEIYPLRLIGEHSHGDGEEHAEHEEGEENIDPHIWLSPKRVMLMVQTIADELSVLDSKNEQVYQDNAKEYIQELEALDDEIFQIVGEMDKKAFMIYHGAYGYFSDDYGLDMIAIEADGKDATASRMKEVIEHAKEENISAIFYQDEFDDAQAQTIASEIGGSVVKSSPLTKDYIQGLKDFANALSDSRE